jgi:ATP-dependent DNA helicase RecQ
MSTSDPPLTSLRGPTGIASASFSDGHWDAIEALVGRRARVLLIQRTRWGWRALYFLDTNLWPHKISARSC